MQTALGQLQRGLWQRTKQRCCASRLSTLSFVAAAELKFAFVGRGIFPGAPIGLYGGSMESLHPREQRGYVGLFMNPQWHTMVGC